MPVFEAAHMKSMREVCDALGLTHVKSLSLEMDVNGPVVVTVFKYVTEGEMQKLVSVLKKYDLQLIERADDKLNG